MRDPPLDGLKNLPDFSDIDFRRLEHRPDLAVVGLDGVGDRLGDVRPDAQTVGRRRENLKVLPIFNNGLHYGDNHSKLEHLFFCIFKQTQLRVIIAIV
jgi:hypothetical protein